MPAGSMVVVVVAVVVVVDCKAGVGSRTAVAESGVVPWRHGLEGRDQGDNHQGQDGEHPTAPGEPSVVGSWQFEDEYEPGPVTGSRMLRIRSRRWRDLSADCPKST